MQETQVINKLFLILKNPLHATACATAHCFLFPRMLELTDSCWTKYIPYELSSMGDSAVATDSCWTKYIPYELSSMGDSAAARIGMLHRN